MCITVGKERQMKSANKVHKLLNLKEGGGGVIVILENIMLPGHRCDQSFQQKDGRPSAMNFLVTSIGFVKGDGPLFTIRPLYRGSVEEDWSYLIKVLPDSGRGEIISVSDEKYSVCLREERL